MGRHWFLSEIFSSSINKNVYKCVPMSIAKYEPVYTNISAQHFLSLSISLSLIHTRKHNCIQSPSPWSGHQLHMLMDNIHQWNTDLRVIALSIKNVLVGQLRKIFQTCFSKITSPCSFTASRAPVVLEWLAAPVFPLTTLCKKNIHQRQTLRCTKLFLSTFCGFDLLVFYFCIISETASKTTREWNDRKL